MLNAFKILALLSILIVGVYGITTIGKWVSYSMFYNDMVRSTVSSMVKRECLNDI